LRAFRRIKLLAESIGRRELPGLLSLHLFATADHHTLTGLGAQNACTALGAGVTLAQLVGHLSSPQETLQEAIAKP
jgi:hypothetical protein